MVAMSYALMLCMFAPARPALPPAFTVHAPLSTNTYPLPGFAARSAWYKVFKDSRSALWAPGAAWFTTSYPLPSDLLTASRICFKDELYSATTW